MLGWGLGIKGLGFRGWGAEFRAWDFGLKEGQGFRHLVLRFRVLGFEFRVSGFRFRVQVLGFGVGD